MRDQFRRAEALNSKGNIWIVDWVRDRYRGFASVVQLPDGETPASVDLTDVARYPRLMYLRRSQPMKDGRPHGWISAPDYSGDGPEFEPSWFPGESAARAHAARAAGGELSGIRQHGTRIR